MCSVGRWEFSRMSQIKLIVSVTVFYFIAKWISEVLSYLMMDVSKRSIVLSNVDVVGVKKRRLPTKHYIYVISVQQSDGLRYFIIRRYRELYELQTRLNDWLLDENNSFVPDKPELPVLPERILFGRSHVRRVAEERMILIEKYCQDLIHLPATVSQSELIVNFFNPNEEDISFWTIPEKTLEEGVSSVVEISDPLVMQELCVVHEYLASSANEISLTVNSTVELIKQTEIGWWYVQMGTKRGWVPAAYLKQIDDSTEENLPTRPNSSEANSTAELYVVKKPYSSYSSVGRRKDELSIVPGMILNILSKNLDGWWLAQSVDGSVGLVPGSFLVPVYSTKAVDLARLLPEICTQAVPFESIDAQGNPIDSCQLSVVKGNAHFTKACLSSKSLP